jgi:hypothetical protein
MLWKDETATLFLEQKHAKVTQRKWEKYNWDFINFKFNKLSDGKLWASILGLIGKGNFLIFMHL